MRSILFWGLCTIIAISWCSCDCYQNIRGTIIDQRSGRPVFGVKVFNKHKPYDQAESDSTGFFEVSFVSGGFTCPDMELSVRYKNYTAFDTIIPSGDSVHIALQAVNK